MSRLEEFIERNAGLLWVILEVSFVIGLVLWVAKHGSLH